MLAVLACLKGPDAAATRSWVGSVCFSVADPQAAQCAYVKEDIEILIGSLNRIAGTIPKSKGTRILEFSGIK